MRLTSFFTSVALCGHTAGMAQDIPRVSTRGLEPVRADILKDDPRAFTVDVNLLANFAADQSAQAFAVFLGQTVPKSCVNMANADVNVTNPRKYVYVLEFKDINYYNAVKKDGCAVVPNQP